MPTHAYTVALYRRQIKVYIIAEKLGSFHYKTFHETYNRMYLMQKPKTITIKNTAHGHADMHPDGHATK
jgi:hypothetical protein